MAERELGCSEQKKCERAIGSVLRNEDTLFNTCTEQKKCERAIGSILRNEDTLFNTRTEQKKCERAIGSVLRNEDTLFNTVLRGYRAVQEGFAKRSEFRGIPATHFGHALEDRC
jgi:hypothetical protein